MAPPLRSVRPHHPGRFPLPPHPPLFAIDHDNRESWLNRVASGMAPLFEALDVPLTATIPGDAFLAAVAPILVAAGPLPNARLDTGSETTRPKKQATRLPKCECEACGYTVRTARKWLEMAGAPLCPVDGHGPMRHDPLGDDGDQPEP